MKVGYIVTLYISKDSNYYENDLKLARDCFESLTYSDDVCLFVYNQGDLTVDEINGLIGPYNLEYHILGSGENVGIPKAKYIIVNHILNNFPEIEYIAETHLDMIFMPNWHIPLIEFLKETDEPMVCSRIICGTNNYYTIQDTGEVVQLPSDVKSMSFKLQELAEDKILPNNFTHPAIYQAKDLRGINFFDVGFLTGKQNFEDTSILIGFSYYMGTKNNWMIKCCLNSCNYHRIEGQRLRTQASDDYNKNLHGLITQYGAYGIKQWYTMTGCNNPYWSQIYESLIINKNAYDE